MKRVIGLLITFILHTCFLSLGVGMTASAQQDISGRLEIISNVAEDDMKEYLDGFLKKYPDVEIDYQCYGDYENEVKKRIDSGDYGDVLFVPSFLSQEQIAEYFRPLGAYVKLEEKYLYMESAKSMGAAVYGLPSRACTTGILYNRDVFYQAGISETPKTIDEFFVALKNIEDRTDAIPFFTNYSSPWALQFWEYFPYIEMTGDSDYRENQFIKEMDPFLKGSTHYQVYELLYNIVEAGLCEDDLTKYSWDEAKEMLNQGEIGCMVIGSWAVSQFKAMSDNPEAIGFMPFPNEIAGRQYMTIMPDYCYGVSRNSDNPETAKAYVEYMLDESGFALEHESLSVVRTDPYPDSFGDMENVILLCSNPSLGDSYRIKQILSTKLDMEDGAEIIRVVEAAMGLRQETFDDIATDWNSRWESSRTPDMEVVEREKVANALFESVLIDNYEVSFSNTEREFLEEKKTLRVGYSFNEPPFEYEKDSEFVGLASYVCALIRENTGLLMEFVPYENTQEMVVALSEGQIDMIAGLDSSGDYDYKLKYSKEYFSLMNVLVKNEAVAVAELEDARMAYVKGENVAYNSQAQEDAAEVYATYADAVAAVDVGAVDCAVMNYYTADYYIQEMECKNVSVMPLAENGKMCFAFAEDVDTRLISICNKCIYGIPEGNLQMVLREYMETTVKPITLRRFVEENPITSLLVVSGVFLLIVLAFVAVILEKIKSAKKHALDVQRYEMLTSLVDEYIIEYDYASERCFFDHKFQEKFAIDKNVKFSVNQDDNENIHTILQNYHQALEHLKETTPPFELTDVDGNTQWYRLAFHVIYKQDGLPCNVIGKLCNVQKDVEELLRVEDMALRDPLTGIFNRKGFDKNLMSLWEKEHLPFTVVVMDLDDFKGVNDTLGHAGGDAVLQILAGKLREVFATNSVIARFGGDEFMVYVYKTDMENVSNLLAKLVKEMDVEFPYQELTRKISVSVGAVYSEHLADFDKLFKEADKALYEIKERGKNGYALNVLE